MNNNITVSESKLNSYYWHTVQCKRKKIVCMNTGEEFNSISDAAFYANVSASNISKACKTNIRAGKVLETGEPLFWSYA